MHVTVTGKYFPVTVFSFIANGIACGWQFVASCDAAEGDKACVLWISREKNNKYDTGSFCFIRIALYAYFCTFYIFTSLQNGV